MGWLTSGATVAFTFVGAVTAGTVCTAAPTAAGGFGTRVGAGAVEAAAPALLAEAVVDEVGDDTFAVEGADTLGLLAAELVPGTLTLTLCGALTCGCDGRPGGAT